MSGQFNSHELAKILKNDVEEALRCFDRNDAEALRARAASVAKSFELLAIWIDSLPAED